MSAPRYYCSFCAQSDAQVEAIFLSAYPNVSICSQCLEVAHGILGERRDRHTAELAKSIGWEWLLP